MAEIALIKVQNGFAFADQIGSENCIYMKHGSYCLADIKKPRNPEFHKKFFAMLNFAFEYFEPPEQEWQGITSVKCFDAFREEVTILAGYRTVTTRVTGEVWVRAKSISFASMGDTEFNQLYNAVFSVLWKLVISSVSGFTEQKMEDAVRQCLGFSA
jgi:hypothetical protein